LFHIPGGYAYYYQLGLPCRTWRQPLFLVQFSAAFIGRVPVTRCAIAGSTYGLQVIWVLTFAALGTVWLQEAAARIIATGYEVGMIIRQTYTGQQGRWVASLLFGAIFLGCAAYQAGMSEGCIRFGTANRLPVSDSPSAWASCALLWISSPGLQ